jgi:aconitate hydratase
MFDLDIIKSVYAGFKQKTDDAKRLFNRPMTYTEKILYAHLWNKPAKPFNRGNDFAEFRLDRVAMQDATAQMALLQCIAIT